MKIIQNYSKIEIIFLVKNLKLEIKEEEIVANNFNRIQKNICEKQFENYNNQFFENIFKDNLEILQIQENDINFKNNKIVKIQERVKDISSLSKIINQDIKIQDEKIEEIIKKKEK